MYEKTEYIYCYQWIKLKFVLNFLIIGTDTIDNIFLKEIIEKFPGLKLKGEFDKLNDANEIIKSEKIDFVLLSSNIIEALNYSNSYFEKQSYFNY